jgi:hypothetical protein
LRTEELSADDVMVPFFKHIIQSSYGMPIYQNINQALEFVIQFYGDDYYASHKVADFSGKTVSTHVELISLVKEMKAQQQFLSRLKLKFKFVTKAT